MFSRRKFLHRTLINGAVAFATLLSVAPFEMGSAMAATEKPFQFLNIIPTKGSEYDSFLALMRTNAKNTRQETGNASFDVFADAKGGNTIYLFERWKNRPGFEAHLKKPYLLAVGEASKTANDGPPTSLELTEVEPTGPAEIKPIADPAKTENIIEVMTAKPEKRDALIAAFAKAMPKLRQADGNISYTLHQEKSNPDHFVLYERWKDAASFKAAVKTPAAVELEKAVKPLLAHAKGDERLMLRDIAEAK